MSNISSIEYLFQLSSDFDISISTDYLTLYTIKLTLFLNFYKFVFKTSENYTYIFPAL